MNYGDAPMANNEAVSTLRLPNRKEYATHASVSGYEADDLYPLSGFPWFEIGALSEDGVVDKYSTDCWMPDELRP